MADSAGRILTTTAIRASTTTMKAASTAMPATGICLVIMVTSIIPTTAAKVIHTSRPRSAMAMVTAIRTDLGMVDLGTVDLGTVDLGTVDSDFAASDGVWDL